MNIYYQGIPGAYSHITSLKVKNGLNITIDNIIGLETFEEVWQAVDQGNVAVLPIENSYAGTIHANIYNFLRYKFFIIGEELTVINHCLVSKSKDIKDITNVFSHRQALAQCDNFLKNNNLKHTQYADTSLAAQMVSQSDELGLAAISSKEAAKLYNLNIVKEGIQDQEGNTTRFLIISKDENVRYTPIKGKLAILFQTKNFQGVLYKCLGAFATNGIDLTKIESLPSQKDPFTYMFWIECLGDLNDKNVKAALTELGFYAKEISVLGEY